MSKINIFILFVGLVFALIVLNENQPAAKQEVLKYAEGKVAGGKTSDLNAEEAEALRMSNQKKDYSYQRMAKQKLKEKLKKYSNEDQLMHAELIKEFDSAIAANPDFDPAVHNISVYEKIAKKYGRDPKNVEAIFLDMQSTQVLQESEVDEFSKKAGF